MMDEMHKGEMGGKMCGCTHHKIFPILVVLFALTFFLGALGTVSQGFVDITWPIIVGVAGLMKLGRCKCC